MFSLPARSHGLPRQLGSFRWLTAVAYPSRSRLLFRGLCAVAVDATGWSPGPLARPRSMIWAVILANICGWPLIQLSIAWIITRLSPRHFMSSRRIDRVTDGEVDFYRRRLQVRRWKTMLPDGAWVGGGHVSPKKAGGSRCSLSLQVRRRDAKGGARALDHGGLLPGCSSFGIQSGYGRL